MSAVVPVVRLLAVPSPRDVLRTLTTMRLAIVVCVVLSGGVITSIATTTDPLWWHLHFSRLGTFRDVSGWFFNGTLIAAGLLVTVFAHHVRRDLRRLGRAVARRGTAVVSQVFLSTIGVNLALVGCVPLNVNKSLHDNVAAGMVLGFAGLLLTSPVLMHRMPRRLVVTTSVIFVFLFAGAWLFVTAAINLALFEVIAFGAMFAWSGVFTHCLSMRSAHLGAPVPADEGGPGAGPADAVSAPDAAGEPVVASPARRAHRAPRRRPRAVASSPRRRPLVRPVAARGARAPLPRGGTASAARGASARWTTPARRSPRSRAAGR